MNGLTTITTKGQMTIPEPIRRALKAKIGDKVSFDSVFPAQRKVVIKIISANAVEELFGSLSSPIKETDYEKAKQGAGKLLAKKYKLG